MAKIQLERINALWFVTLGVTALAAGILIYILLIESALGAFSIREAAPTNIGRREQPRVALLRSDYTKQAHVALNGDSGGTEWIDATMTSWREFLLDRSRNISFSEITDAQIEAGELEAFDTLILPSTRAMSDEQIEQVKAFMERGGSVLATWTPGIYYPDGTWRGWRFIEEAFGVAFVDFVERGTGNYRVYQDTFPGYTPPGIYRPDYSIAQEGDAGGADPHVADMRRRAADADFPALRGYRWIADGNEAPPQADHAVADTLTIRIRGVDGRLEWQRAVAVSYYTWTGSSTATQTPYPYTGTGIRKFTLRGNTPLTAGISGGYRLKVQVYNPGVRMRVLEPRTTAAGFWYDFATEDGVISDALSTTTGIVYGTYGQGRFVYLGMQRDAMGVGPDDREDYAVLSRFFTNIINYLRRVPVIWVHDWPFSSEHPYEAAAMITGLGDGDIQNFSGVADILAQENVPGTYFVRPEQAGAHRALLQRLHASGDVGVMGNLLRDQDGPERSQRERLESWRTALEQIVGGPVTGYRSMQRGQFGDVTMGALRGASYQYFVPDSIGRRTMPKIMGFPYETLIRIGVSAHSDREVFDVTPGETPELRTLFFEEDMTRVRYEGGLYNLLYSSDLLARPENRDVMRGLVKALKRQNYWIASGDEVTHWWRLRQGLNVDIEQRGPHRIVMRVSNNNGATASEMGVTIALGRAVENVRIQPELVGIMADDPRPEPILQANNTELVLVIKQLKPQQNRIFHIDLIDAASRQLTER